MENQVYGKELIEIQEIKFPVGPMIYAQMAKCIRDIAAVNKTKMIDNKKPYRGIDDVTNAVKPVLGEHGIVPVSQVVGEPYFEERAQGKATYVRLCLSVVFYAIDGSHVDYLFWGDAIVYGSGALMSATTYAYRQVLEKAFCITTDDSVNAEKPQAEAEDEIPRPPAPAKAKLVQPNQSHGSEREGFKATNEKQVDSKAASKTTEVSSKAATGEHEAVKPVDKTGEAYRRATINKLYKLHAKEAKLLNLPTPKPHEMEISYNGAAITQLEEEGKRLAVKVKNLCIEEITECYNLEHGAEINTPKDQIFTPEELRAKKLDELWEIMEASHRRLEQILEK